ncbi:hypothetical protein B0A49_09845 [Cryomyces minteri]|uniref:Uncharacterized protein n=1 Tax=Cryomyces minteri TaxID=331657 RepID=A0A4U0WJ77_9PEZI|nr:hypothetical protein B0A49_09845 [Cryomyces minteri]
MTFPKAPGSIPGHDAWILEMVDSANGNDSAFAEALKAPVAQGALAKAWEFFEKNKAVYDIETAHLRLVTVGDSKGTLWLYYCKHNGDSHRFKTGVSFGRNSTAQESKDTSPSETAGTVNRGPVIEDSTKKPVEPVQTLIPDQTTKEVGYADNSDLADWTVIPNNEDGEWELLEGAS